MQRIFDVIEAAAPEIHWIQLEFPRDFVERPVVCDLLPDGTGLFVAADAAGANYVVLHFGLLIGL